MTCCKPRKGWRLISHESYSVYVIICVTLASVELRNATVCHTGKWHATPLHTWPNTWHFYMIALCMIWLVMSYMYSTVAFTATGIPGTASMQPHQHRKGICFLFDNLITLNSALRTISWRVILFYDSRVSFRGLASLFLFSFRTFQMTTPRWSSMWILLTVWWWRATCSRGPAMPSRPGTGTNKTVYCNVNNVVCTRWSITVVLRCIV